MVEDVKGGISQVFAAVLKPIFLDKKCDPRLGLLLPKPGAPSLKLYVDLQVVLQDKFCWSYKGDAALKPCLLCNAEYDTEAIDDDDMGGACFGHFLTYNSLRIYSSEEILQSYDRLKAKKHELSKAQFLIWQKAAGKTYQDMILPLDPDIREANLLAPAEQFAHDWMHCLCSNGTFRIAAFELLHATNAWEDLGPYLAKWVLPAHCHMKHLPDLFEDKKSRSTSSKKSSNVKLQKFCPFYLFWCSGLKRCCCPATLPQTLAKPS